jgi:RNA polymerase sigma-70 factor (ECF subfamily)
LNAYLQKTARNLVLNQFRKQNNGLKASEQWANSQFADSLLDRIMQADLEKQAESLIEQLPEQRRRIFIMAKVQHLPVAEIANNLNLSQRTVENQLFRATKFLRMKLKHLQTELQVIFLLMTDFIF